MKTTSSSSSLCINIRLTNISYYENCRYPGGHVLKRTVTNFELSQAIIRTNLSTKFHEDWTRNVTSRVKSAPSPGDHIFQQTGTIFKLSLAIISTNTIHVTPRVLSRKTAPPPGDIIETNTKNKTSRFDEDWAINVTSRFLFSNIIGTNLLIKFHEDQTINVASRVLTRQTGVGVILGCDGSTVVGTGDGLGR
ncbi:hypothetical protein DPMN_045093 [Dreissena polymorpha]|uniref:Uncharacterized protein n=1 Tax=Dreissena polymorpha TaxID=45954 RepID=A0A9D4HZB8_DREPO|nr:hypothetical protein DPMN_045093 [Dreissena polymorpha]